MTLKLLNRKEVSTRLFQRVLGQAGFDPKVRCGPKQLLKKITRIRLSQLLLHLSGQKLDKPLRQARIGRKQPHFALPAENLHELLRRRVIEGNLVWNAPLECRVREPLRVKISSEDDQHVKGNRKLHSAGQTQVIHAPVERRQPSVEQC